MEGFLEADPRVGGDAEGLLEADGEVGGDWRFAGANGGQRRFFGLQVCRDLSSCQAADSMGFTWMSLQSSRRCARS